MKYPVSIYPAKLNGVSVWVAESDTLPLSASANTPFQALLNLQEAEAAFVEDAFARGSELPDIPTKVLSASSPAMLPKERSAPMPMQQEELTIYTDGACSGNPGPGGWAFLILSNGKEIAGSSGGEHATTNNRMEMMALYQALKHVGGTPKKLTVISDSQYVIKTMQGSFSKKKNQDLWALLDEEAAKHDIEYKWVRGHTGDHFNEKCDFLAVMESRRA